MFYLPLIINPGKVNIGGDIHAIHILDKLVFCLVFFQVDLFKGFNVLKDSLPF